MARDALGMIEARGRLRVITAAEAVNEAAHQDEDIDRVLLKSAAS
jgi:hypothetical protein